jgi:mRNA-degrading endonuclease YafQ of YafQ-DinJ toxin-antitoxin module
MKKTKYRITYSSKFDRDYRKLVKGNKGLSKRIIKAIKQLSIDPFYPGLRTHMVDISDIGKIYSSRVTGDLRVLWSLKEGNIIFLYRIGGHSGSSKIYK